MHELNPAVPRICTCMCLANATQSQINPLTLKNHAFVMKMKSMLHARVMSAAAAK